MVGLGNLQQYTFIDTIGGRILESFMQGHEIPEIATLQNMSVRDIRIQINRFIRFAGRNSGSNGQTLNSDRRNARIDKERFYSEIEKALAENSCYREFITGEFIPRASNRTRHVLLAWTDICTNDRLKECIVTGLLDQRNYKGENLHGFGVLSFRECCIGVGLNPDNYLREA